MKGTSSERPRGGRADGAGVRRFLEAEMRRLLGDEAADILLQALASYDTRGSWTDAQWAEHYQALLDAGFVPEEP